MVRSRRLSVDPRTAIAVLALFFALGGSALAVGERVQGTTTAQPRCANGAVRGIAMVTGGAGGVANVPGQFTGAGSLFARKFNCNHRATQVRRVAMGVFEVRFVGNAARTATASATGDVYANVETVVGGAFRVSLHPAGRDDLVDTPFAVVAV
jgi:hypothetical protein